MPDDQEEHMSDKVNDDEWLPLEENDPPPDCSREVAAYEREKERLRRDHLGKIALIRKDEVVGVFDTADEATCEGLRRFGFVRFILMPIEEDRPPPFVGLVDLTHPSIRFIKKY
jgi:hypothetical protein